MDNSVIMCPAIMSPATEGTQLTDAGMLRLPGGGASSASGVNGSSGEKSTVCRVMPLAFSSLRTTRARGQPEVLLISETENRLGSSLLPVPRALMMGICSRWAFSIRLSLQLTRSLRSARKEYLPHLR